MKQITILTPEKVHAIVAEIKVAHPEWTREQVGNAVRTRFRKSHFFTASDNSGVIGFVDPVTVFFVLKVLLYVGLIGWKFYKGDAEIPDDAETWIEEALDLI